MQFGDHSILLEIGDENLVQFVKREYITARFPGDTHKGVSLSVQPSSTELFYIIRERGVVKRKVSIPLASDTPYKEFILQGMIEVSLADTGMFFMHASSFIERGVLHVFLGPSGSGKTTILKQLDPKRITSNDTLVLFRNDDESVNAVYPSPFDGNVYGRIKVKSILIREIVFYSLVHAQENTLTLLPFHEQIELLVQNMNRYMFSVQKGVARKSEYKKTLQEEAIRLAFFLSKSKIRRLAFNREITGIQFNRMTYQP